MRRIHVWGGWILAAAFAVVPGVRPAVAQDVAGLAFDVRVTTGDSTAGTHQTGRGWIAGKMTRLDMRGGAGMSMPAMPGMGAGDVSIIVRDSSDTALVTLVMHEQKTFMYPSKMMTQLQEMMASLVEKPKMTFSVTNIVVDSMGAGETVSGFTTKRYRVSADISMAIEMMGESTSQTMHVESEGDYAEELSDFADPLRGTRGFRAMTDGMPWMDSIATAELQKLERMTPRGLALRHVDRVTGVTEGDMPIPTTITTLSNIKREAIASSVFAIPEGYTEMQMPAMPQVN